MTPAERRAVRSTYRSLRLGVVILLLFLGAAVGVEAVAAGCWLDSLSAYYWTGAHDALVAALCAVGVLLVVYTGVDDLEDALLDVAGFLAVVVALTPTEPLGVCPGAEVAEVPEALAEARTGLTALVLAGLVMGVARTVVAVRARLPLAATVLRLAVVVPAAVLAVTFVVAPDLVLVRAHDLSAVLLFVAVVGVVVRHAFLARATSTRWGVGYIVLGTTMLLTLSAVVALHAVLPGWGHTVLVLEVALVGQFAAFWLLQTIELWGTDVPRARRSPRVPGPAGP